MKKTEKEQILATFRTIPGVGKSIAQDFWDIGLRSMNDLNNANPEALYLMLCSLKTRTWIAVCSMYFGARSILLQLKTLILNYSNGGTGKIKAVNWDHDRLNL